MFKQLENAKHYLMLKLVFCLDFLQVFDKLPEVGIGHYISYGVFKTGFFDHTGHVVFKRTVVVGGYFFKIFLHFICNSKLQR